MLDIQSVDAPHGSRDPFRSEAAQWTLARDRYLAGVLSYKGLVAATRHLLARTLTRLKGLALFYGKDRHRPLVGVTAITTNNFSFALPSFDDRLGVDGPPWYRDPAVDYLTSHMDEDSFEEAGRVVAQMLGGVSANYEDVSFLLLTVAFVARDSEGALTELCIQ